MSDLLGKLLRAGAEVTAAVVEKGLDKLEEAEARRREFEQKAAKTVIKAVDVATKKKEEFDAQAEKTLGQLADVFGQVVGAVLTGEAPEQEHAEVQPLPAKLEKPKLQQPQVTRPKATVLPESAVVTPKKRGGSKKRPAAGKKHTR